MLLGFAAFVIWPAALALAPCLVFVPHAMVRHGTKRPWSGPGRRATSDAWDSTGCAAGSSGGSSAVNAARASAAAAQAAVHAARAAEVEAARPVRSRAVGDLLRGPARHRPYSHLPLCAYWVAGVPGSCPRGQGCPFRHAGPGYYEDSGTGPGDHPAAHDRPHPNDLLDGRLPEDPVLRLHTLAALAERAIEHLDVGARRSGQRLILAARWEALATMLRSNEEPDFEAEDLEAGDGEDCDGGEDYGPGYYACRG